MRNSRLHAIGLAVGMILSAGSARAASPAQGFDAERLYLSPAGGGWFVMDSLDMRGGFGGAVELTGSYAHNPVVVTQGSSRLAVVRDDAFADVGLALTYDRFRLSFDVPQPIAILGQAGTIGGAEYTAPSFDLGKNPDTISDPRLGFDARLFGAPRGVFRFGLSGQLFFQSGNRADYVTDGTCRAMFRALFAGDAGLFTYAAQLGVHVRPLYETGVSGAPRGSELLFGVAAGARIPAGRWDVVLGPEVFGETAFSEFFGQYTTGLEALLSARIEGTGPGMQLRVKIGAGGGLDPAFGTPGWRIVVAVETFNRGQAR